MLRIFIGFEVRQPIAFSVFSLSLLAQSTKPLSITPMVLGQLPITRKGLTDFTYSRFLVPHLCDFRGQALFLDADMLCLTDIAELFALADPEKAVMTVDTKPAFERAAVMLFNCEHQDNKKLTPEFIQHADFPLHKIGWTKNRGDLPTEWNHLVLYDQPREDAKLVHFTGGIPCFPETFNCEYSRQWKEWADMARSSVPWEHLMGNSVHRGRVHAAQKYAQA